MCQLVILAGGKGTRLAECLLQPDGSLLPKPLIPVLGVPLLQRQLLHAKRYGVKDVVILVNHRADAIKEFCEINSCFGLNVRLIDDGEPRGTAGAVLAALNELEDVFLVMYGDTLLNVDLSRFVDFHKQGESDVTLFLHPNDHPHDSDLVEIDDDGYIAAIHPYPHPRGIDFRNLVNAALYCIEKSSLNKWLNSDTPLDFCQDLFPLMLESGQLLSGYVSPEYIKDVGTPSRLARSETALVSGRFAEQTLSRRQRAVFLDRDGVINQEAGHISHSSQFSLLAGAAEAIRVLNHAGWLVVVVTNQPVVARGECAEHELRGIHNRMEALLGAEGAYIDRLYYCPHHPDKGFKGERIELKGPCVCRKPATGMIEEACNDMNIELSRSWFVGDRTVDIQCALNAGIRSILVKTGMGGSDCLYDVQPDRVENDLMGAVKFILSKKKKLLGSK